MKNFFKFLSLAGIVATIAMMAACTNAQTDTPETPEDPTPDVPAVTYSMSAASKSVNPSDATIELETENIVSYAYMVQKKSEQSDLLPDVILAGGITGTCDEDGKTEVVVKSLMPESTYVVKFVGVQSDEEFYKDIVSVEFTTGAYTDEITFFNNETMSVSVHINLPEGAIQEGNVVKWGLYDAVTINMEEGNMAFAERINQHDEVYANYFTDKVTLTFNEETNWFLPPEEYRSDDEDIIARWYPLSPGQPSHLVLGEFKYNPIESSYRAGWGPGYYDWCFDFEGWLNQLQTTGNADETAFWNGYFKNIEFKVKDSEPMDIVPDITFNLTPKGTGTIDVTFKDGICYSCVAILDKPTLNYVMPYLNNNKSWLPWYITSYNAFINIGALSLEKSTQLVVEDLYFLDRDTEYVMMVSSLSDEVGTKRSYYETPFKLPQPKLPAPEAEITAVPDPNTGNTSDEFVWFNLRAKNKDADIVKYIANYEREWMQLQKQYTKAGYSEQEAIKMILDQYGATITAIKNENGTYDTTEIDAINSDKGYTIQFSSRADATTICGFVVYNSEGTPSEVVVATARSDKEKAATPIESTLYEDLKGDWTLTATVTGQEYVNNILTPFTREHSSDVTIGDISYETTLPEEVYMIYSRMGFTPEEVDAFFQQFCTAVDDFNANTRAQNRILCNGFDFEISEYAGLSYAAYRDPYSLFIDTEYSGYNYESPIFDFGPKWYFQVQEGGTTVTVPFDITYFAPSAQWRYYVYQLVPVNQNGYLPYATTETGEKVMGQCPVEISEDKNTITIKPFVDRENQTYYLCLCRYFESQGGQMQVPLRIVSDIVLKRKATTEVASVKATSAGKNIKAQTISTNIPFENKMVRMASRTAFNTAAKIVKPETKSIRVVNEEMFRQNVKNYVEGLRKNRAKSNR